MPYVNKALILLNEDKTFLLPCRIFVSWAISNQILYRVQPPHLNYCLTVIMFLRQIGNLLI